ncbi:MAG: AmmeMemoRadiSam system protein B [Acidobacteria bacterium]|nr:MAG: AmmeMemoRadiSam system protein B [Acidobacteriota bacterium]
MQVRPAAVAGTFYPSHTGKLRPMIKGYVKAAEVKQGEGNSPKAVIAPHAGYIYSGPTAAFSFARLASEASLIRRIVLLGPPHRVPVKGLALPGVEGFETPLGVVPVDEGLVSRISIQSQVSVSATAHAPEHSLEVELPFLQVLLGEFSILPLLVGDTTPNEVAEVLDRVWGGVETRIVISTDLSHYHGYSFARHIDQQTADQIVDLQAAISPRQACGAAAVNGFLVAARRRGLSSELLDLRNSGDTAGDKSQVVGYGAFAFHEWE